MAAPFNRFQNLRSLRFANADLAFATAFATLVTGTFQVGFIKMVGGGDLWIGVLSAIPSLLGILQIPGAIWGRSFASYKLFVFPGGLIWRLFYVPLIALPLLPILGEAKLIALALCVGIASAAVLIVQPIYNEWIMEMVPPNSRGWFFGRRNALGTAVGAGVGILGGLLIDGLREHGREPLGLAIVFGCGALCAAGSLVFFMLTGDIPREHPIRENLRASIRAMGKPFADREFRWVLIFLAVFFIGQTFAGNLYSAYALESLKLSFTVIQLTGVMNAIGIVVAAPFWGFLADRYGNKPILILSGLGIATNPIAWIFTIPGNPTQNIAVLLPGHLIMGFFWSGVTICQFNLLFATAKPEDRANYLGAGLALQSLAAGVAPMFGASLMTLLRGTMSVALAYKGVFVGVGVLRAASILFLKPVKEEGSSRVGRTLKDLRRVGPGAMRTMRTLARSSDTAKRAAALEQVADQGLTLASDEVVRALTDPSPQIRRQAADTLARLGDASFVTPLLEHIADHPDLVEEETIRALGEIGAEEAVDTLVSYLQSPRSLLRRAAARALGRLRSRRAIGPLIQAAGEVEDADLQRSSIQALRRIGAREASEVIAEALGSSHAGVRIAAAEAVAELHLVEALPQVRESLETYRDEATGEVAYALSVVGSLAELPPVLEAAVAMKTGLSRRRCLLGIARLLGVESATYRLFLKTEMARDTDLVDLLQPVMRRSRKVKAAMERYASGDEPAALRLLAQASNDPIVDELSRRPVRDLYLVVAAYVAQSYSPTSKQSSARGRESEEAG